MDTHKLLRSNLTKLKAAITNNKKNINNDN